MTIEKAIQILTQLRRGCLYDVSQDSTDALTLGIKALERVEDGRKKGYDYFGHKLPGETEK